MTLVKMCTTNDFKITGDKFSFTTEENLETFINPPVGLGKTYYIVWKGFYLETPVVVFQLLSMIKKDHRDWIFFPINLLPQKEFDEFFEKTKMEGSDLSLTSISDEGGKTWFTFQVILPENVRPSS